MRLFSLFFIILIIQNSHCEFIKSKDTELIALLNDAVYSSQDKSLGSNSEERIQNRFVQYTQMFPSAQEYLNHIKIVHANEDYSFFVNEQTKQAYLTVRGTNVKDIYDLGNDAQIIAGYSPKRVKSVNQFINSEMAKYANDGYSTTISGHSLGGSIAIISCIENKWISHCEPHNPYLSDTLLEKLISMSSKDSTLKDRLLIQKTEGDSISDMDTEKLSRFNITMSIFDRTQSVSLINCHSSLTFIAKAIFGDESTYIFDKSGLYTAEVLYKGLKQFYQEVSETISYDIDVLKDFLNKTFESFGKSVQCYQDDYYDFDSSLCSICPPGKSCEDTFSPYLCSQGQYLDKNQRCISCPKGSYNSKIGSSSCQDCPIGSVCPSGSSSPQLCQKGTYYYNGSCYNCQIGQYQDQPGQKSCNICPSGYKCPDVSMSPVICQPGSYRDQGDSFQSGKAAVSCYLCHNGDYQDQPGQKSCKTCPNGFKCPETSESPIICEPGTFRNNDFSGYTGSNAKYCYWCNKGYYQDQPGSTGCKTCPEGYKCPSLSESPISCEPGTFRNNDFSGYTGANAIYCYKCSSGYYQDQPGKAGCKSCPEGFQCPSISESPISCEPGTFRNNSYPGYTGANAMYCYWCNKGYYTDQPGSTGCKTCPEGYKCPSLSESPISCEPGTFRNNSNSAYTGANAMYCYWCKQGYFQDQAGQTGCKTCPTGYSCPERCSSPILINNNSFLQK